MKDILSSGGIPFQFYSFKGAVGLTFHEPLGKYFQNPARKIHVFPQVTGSELVNLFLVIIGKISGFV